MAMQRGRGRGCHGAGSDVNVALCEDSAGSEHPAVTMLPQCADRAGVSYDETMVGVAEVKVLGSDSVRVCSQRQLQAWFENLAQRVFKLEKP